LARSAYKNQAAERSNSLVFQTKNARPGRPGPGFDAQTKNATGSVTQPERYFQNRRKYS